MHKAFFLDRDGVINVDKSYVYKVEDFEFIDGVFDTLKYIQSKGYKLFIVTNQSGIGRGYYTIEDFLNLTLWMKNEFKNNDINIEDVQYCPHAPEENCNCRKPKTGMVDNILQKFDIDLENSWFVGDKDSDIKCANSANIKNSVQVKSGQDFDENKTDAKYVLNSITEIKNLI